MFIIGTEEFNNESLRMNAAWMIYDNNKEYYFKSFLRGCFELWFYENLQTKGKSGLKPKKIKIVAQLNKRNYHLKKRVINTWILIKYVGFRKNMKRCGLIFYYNIITDPLFGIGYVTVRIIPCSY